MLMIESIETDRSFLIRREKELELKSESADSAKAAIDKAEARVEELELKFQNSVVEKNELEAKMEEAVQDSGTTDVKSEFNVMASALSKEMGMVEAQLNRWEDIAQEALSLRGEAETKKALLSRKTCEVKALGDKCAQQTAEIKSLKELIEELQKEQLELQVILDLLGQGIYDNRTCEICGKPAKNIGGIEDTGFRAFGTDTGIISLADIAMRSGSYETDHRFSTSFSRFLLVAVVLAFILPWAIHPNRII